MGVVGIDIMTYYIINIISKRDKGGRICHWPLYWRAPVQLVRTLRISWRLRRDSGWPTHTRGRGYPPSSPGLTQGSKVAADGWLLTGKWKNHHLDALQGDNNILTCIDSLLHVYVHVITINSSLHFIVVSISIHYIISTMYIHSLGYQPLHKGGEGIAILPLCNWNVVNIVFTMLWTTTQVATNQNHRTRGNDHSTRYWCDSKLITHSMSKYCTWRSHARPHCDPIGHVHIPDMSTTWI